MKSKLASQNVAHEDAFTLIELLTVIAIIGILAAILVGGAGSWKKSTSKKRVETELQKLAVAIEGYKAKHGFFPPDNTNDPARPPLFYELMGTYTANNGSTYSTLDGREAINQATIVSSFNIGGFMNTAASAGTGRGFLTSPKPSEYMDEPVASNAVFLVAPVPGTNINTPKFNPWRYVSSNPTNNPKTYDLWAEIVIGDETNIIIGNWK